MKIAEVIRYQQPDTKKWHVVFKYAPKDVCFCSAKKVTKVFDYEPSLEDLEKAISKDEQSV